MHRLGAQALHLRQPWEGARSLHESHPRHLSSVGDCSPRRVPRNSIQCPGDRTDCLVQLGSGKPPPFFPLFSHADITHLFLQINRFIHPALLDCVAAYTCVRESPALTVPQMETFFQKHLQNRATCSSSGPSNLWDYATAYTILTGVVQTSVTRSQLKKNPFSSNNPFAGSNQRGNHTVQFQHISGSNISNGSHFRNQRGKPKGNRGVGKRGGGQNSAQGNNHVANPAQVVTPPFSFSLLLPRSLKYLLSAHLHPRGTQHLPQLQ